MSGLLLFSRSPNRNPLDLSLLNRLKLEPFHEQGIPTELVRCESRFTFDLAGLEKICNKPLHSDWNIAFEPSQSNIRFVFRNSLRRPWRSARILQFWQTIVQVQSTRFRAIVLASTLISRRTVYLCLTAPQSMVGRETDQPCAAKRLVL